MSEDKAVNDYIIWGIDDAAYGPVQLPVLGDWVMDERVLKETWVFARHGGTWQRAEEMAELKNFFTSKATARSPLAKPVGIKPGSLRRVKILAGLSDEQLAQLFGFLEPQAIGQWSVVVKQGEPGDAMYLILDGELPPLTRSTSKYSVLPADAFQKVGCSAALTKPMGSAFDFMSLHCFRRIALSGISIQIKRT